MSLLSPTPASRSAGVGVVAGLCAALTLPPFNLVYFIWLFPIPLLWVVARQSTGEALITAYVFGLVAMNQATYGLLGYDQHIWLLIFVVAPLWGLLPVWLISWVKRRQGINRALLLAPFVWVSVQTLLLDIAKLPLDIAVVFTHSLIPLQLVSVLGSSVLPFIVVLTGALITRALLYMAEHKVQAAVPYILGSLGVPLATFALGHILLDLPLRPCVTKVATAQPVIPIH